MYVCMYACIHVCMCMYACMYVCMRRPVIILSAVGIIFSAVDIILGTVGVIVLSDLALGGHGLRGVVAGVAPGGSGGAQALSSEDSEQYYLRFFADSIYLRICLNC